MDLQHLLVILPRLSSGCVFPISKTTILPFFYFLYSSYFSCWLCLFSRTLLVFSPPRLPACVQVPRWNWLKCPAVLWNWLKHPQCVKDRLLCWALDFSSSLPSQGHVLYSPPFKKNWKEFQTLLINCKYKNCTENIHIPFKQILLSLTFDPICFILCTLLLAHNFFPEPFEAKLHASWLLLLSTSVWIF